MGEYGTAMISATVHHAPGAKVASAASVAFDQT